MHLYKVIFDKKIYKNKYKNVLCKVVLIYDCKKKHVIENIYKKDITIWKTDYSFNTIVFGKNEK